MIKSQRQELKADESHVQSISIGAALQPEEGGTAETAAAPVASSSSVRMYPVASLISLERTSNLNANKGLGKEKGNTLKKEKICVQIAANQQFPTEFFLSKETWLNTTSYIWMLQNWNCDDLTRKAGSFPWQ